MLKKLVRPITALILFTVLLCLCGCSNPKSAEAEPSLHSLPEYEFHPEWLSDDLDERFQQIFYYSLDNPTVDQPFPPDSNPDCTIPSGNGNYSYLFNQSYFREQNLSKGAFFYIEPPYSVVSVGLDRYVLRGIYDIKGGERNKDGIFRLQSLSMQIDLGECQLSDLDLSYRDLFRLKNQHIPLTTEERDGILYITADLDKVSPIELESLQQSFTLKATITYHGNHESISSLI